MRISRVRFRESSIWVEFVRIKVPDETVSSDEPRDGNVGTQGSTTTGVCGPSYRTWKHS